jgi:ribosome biogenesis GTPase
VQWSASEDGGSIESIETRKNIFYRQDEIRTKSFAANIDQVLVLVAAEPDFSQSQLSRALIAARHEGIRTLIGLNKQDLGDAFARAWQKLLPYQQLGCLVLPLSLKDLEQDLSALNHELANRVTLVLGPSGAGKSTLINRLVPNAKAATNIISQALQSGKHTTTSTTWYWVDETKKTASIWSSPYSPSGSDLLYARYCCSCRPLQIPQLQPCA